MPCNEIPNVQFSEHPGHDQRPADRLVRAAQYIRMSTEHQQYSTENQSDVIREYAARRGYDIVKTYADEGKSGLRIESREALKRLIADVQASQTDFSAILVYDVSRWGRFQDADESAYYEYCCKRVGIAVHYCAEQFENDGGPTSTIIKSVKRAMAGEYSRELSCKVFQGQCRLIELGYRQGGTAGFGLRRMLLDQAGLAKGMLKRGERKSLQTDRVILVPGPQEEQEIVRSIYRQFVEDGRSEGEIAAELNAKGITTDFGRSWSRNTVRELLTNEKYIGHNVYNRTSFKLKKKHVTNTPDMWVRHDNAFQPMVSQELFFKAQGIIQERNRRFTDEEMLARLRALLKEHRTISAFLIDSADGPCSSAYRTRFGSLVRAYQLAGYEPERDYRYLEINRAMRLLYSDLLCDLIRRLSESGATVSHDATSNLLIINKEYSAVLAMSRCRQTAAGSLRWLVQIDERIAPDITILVRMDSTNQRPADFYLLPVMDVDPTKLLLCESNGAYLDTYQFDSLDYFAAMAMRTRIETAA